MSLSIISLFVFYSTLLSIVHASLYVTSPDASTVCTAGKSCTIQWLDDGISPLLSTMGPCNVALYTGKQRALQQIASLDVSDSHSVTFKPDPKAGPDSSQYYIGFTSLKPNDNGTHWLGFSAHFTIDGMKGSFDSPMPDASSSKPFSSVQGVPTSTSVSTVSGGPGSGQGASASSTANPSSTPSGFVTSSSTGPSATATPPNGSSDSVAAPSPSSEPSGAAVGLFPSVSSPLSLIYLSIPFFLMI